MSRIFFALFASLAVVNALLSASLVWLALSVSGAPTIMLFIHALLCAGLAVAAACVAVTTWGEDD